MLYILLSNGGGVRAPPPADRITIDWLALPRGVKGPPGSRHLNDSLLGQWRQWCSTMAGCRGMRTPQVHPGSARRMIRIAGEIPAGWCCPLARLSKRPNLPNRRQHRILRLEARRDDSLGMEHPARTRRGPDEGYLHERP